MRKIYEDHRYERVGHFQSILESEGIATLIKNEAIDHVEASFPNDLIDLPELWVVDGHDYDRAIGILKPLYDNLSK